MRRVVVTGLGLVTPLGIGVEHVWKRLLNSESGIGAIQGFDVSDLPAKIAGQVPRGETAAGKFNADEWVPPKDQRKMDDFIIFAIGAATQAVSDSGWTPTGRGSARAHRRDDRLGHRRPARHRRDRADACTRRARAASRPSSSRPASSTWPRARSRSATASRAPTTPWSRRARPARMRSAMPRG